MHCSTVPNRNKHFFFKQGANYKLIIKHLQLTSPFSLGRIHFGSACKHGQHCQPLPILAPCTSSLSTGSNRIWSTAGQGQGDLFLLAVPLPRGPHLEGLHRHSLRHPPASTQRSHKLQVSILMWRRRLPAAAASFIMNGW